MISVILPSYNSEKTIGRCLSALERQKFTGEYEVILADSSQDRTPEIVTRKHPHVHMIRFPVKTDPGTARNMGIQIARGDIIAFIDSDCIAAEDWLERILKAHQDSRARVVGGVVRNGNQKTDLVAWAGYMAEFREFLPGQPKRYLMHIPTCNISYRKSLFEEFGLFQGKYYPQEDLVYNYSLWKNGEKILLDPSIKVSHLHRTRLDDFLKHQEKIGGITCRVLKEIPLQGSRIARQPLLGLAATPFLPAVKFLKTLMAFSRFREEIPHKIKVFLILALGLAFWTKGFGRMIIKDNR